MSWFQKCREERLVLCGWHQSQRAVQRLDCCSGMCVRFDGKLIYAGYGTFFAKGATGVLGHYSLLMHCIALHPHCYRVYVNTVVEPVVLSALQLPGVRDYFSRSSSQPAGMHSGPIHAMALHPNRSICAVAMADDSVHFFDLAAESACARYHLSSLRVVAWWNAVALAHDFQRDVIVIEFQPNSACTVAVACRHGVCLWTVANGSAWCRMLASPGHEPVQALSFSPCGQYLATGSSADGTVLVWDTAADVHTPLVRAGAGVAMLRWAPSGLYLFVATR